MSEELRLWRVFPWDPGAAEGERFSAAFVPGGQGRGRFDLPGEAAGVLYLAESPEHAVAELIQRYRNQPAPLEPADLTAYGHALALVEVTVRARVAERIADLCDPEVLARHAIAPDRTAARDRAASQSIAAGLHAGGYAGLRWWSAFFGEWHTVVLFRGRLAAGDLRYAGPARLSVDDSAVREAARSLDVPLR
ncbi:MAG TPA: RES family NAD+ phosphorylase [Longimicrobium sp.]